MSPEFVGVCCIVTCGPNEVLLDAIDIDVLQHYKWRVKRSKSPIPYVMQGGDSRKGVPSNILHRVLTGCPVGKVVDHKNLNTLDNRRSNLRVCTISENCMNRRGLQGKLKGVTKLKPRGNKDRAPVFRASVKVGGKVVWSREYDTPESAHEAYCCNARKYHGEFARLK